VRAAGADPGEAGMTLILVIVPTLGRPGKLCPLAGNIRDATKSDVVTLFVLEPEDDASWDAAVELEGLALIARNSRKRNWSGAVNSGYASACYYQVPFTHVLAGADDLRFADGWDVPALGLLASRPELRVAGTNDLHNPSVLAGHEATAYLIDRRYIDETGGVADQPPGTVQCDAYRHNFTDTEFVATARARGVWAPCLDSVVEHCHPAFGLAGWDDGYRMSQDPAGFAADEAVFRSRRRLWENAVP
jgi:hypothetical protein